MMEKNSVTALFTQQALICPQAIAVIDKDESITYGALNATADKICRYLLDKGVTRDVLVPIVIENGIYTITAILGILKAGSAFVPVDPSYPQERIAYILQDSQCKVVITTADIAQKLSLENYDLLLLQNELFQPELTSDAAGYLYPAQTDLAYVIYTSGSTGRPKGVMVEHSQLFTYLMDVDKRFNLAECNSYAILGTFSADAGYTAVFAALCFGKRLTVINIKELSNFEQLVHRLEAYPVDCYKTTPSLMHLFLQNKAAQRVLPVKKLILGGESCSWTLAKDVYDLLLPGCRLYNHYGPTETTIGVITYEFPENSNYFPDVISLGKPLENVTAHILTEEMEQSPAGTPGELYIEGPLVARGYLNNPTLTSGRFVYITVAGERRRLYKTGDIVKMLPNGNIEYLGRSDEQVKIFGNRIELKEIEQVVLATGMVSKCAVVARKNNAGDQYLVGYITPAAEFETATLIKAVQLKLPAYMVPWKWVVMHEWPLTFNNKIDRKALPEPEAVSNSSTGEETALNNPLETSLSVIWKRLLDIEALNYTDDFFELGGNSLLLIKLCFEIYTVLQLEVTVTELFGRLTIKSLAAYLKKQSTGVKPDECLTGFNEKEASDTQRNMFVQNLLNPALNFPNSTITLEILGDIDLNKLELAFKKIINANESLRTAFYISAGKVYKNISTHIDFKIQIVLAAGNDIDGEIMQVMQPYNFRTLPLIRLFVIRLPDSRSFFHLDMPHINSDGESLKIIMDDLQAVYNGNVVGRKRLQYTDFQKKVYSYRHSPRFKADEQFWRQQLENDVPSLQFGSRQKTANRNYTGAYYISPLSPDLNEKINSFIKNNGFSKFQIFLSAYYLVLFRICSANTVLAMVPVHNRNEKGMEDVPGLLSNVVLVKNSIDHSESIQGYLTKSRYIILEALRHQRFPFEKQMEIWKEKGRDVKKLFNTFFGYHYHPGIYTLHSAVLKLYIPSRSKENLPLSIAVFETSEGITMRLSSTSGFYGEQELNNIATLYCQMLGKLATFDKAWPIGMLLDPTHEILA